MWKYKGGIVKKEILSSSNKTLSLSIINNFYSEITNKIFYQLLKIALFYGNVIL